MIGESSRRIDLRLDTQVADPENSTSNLRFEGGGPGAEPLTLKQEGGDTFLLKDGERIPIQNPAGLAAPTNNFLDYLAAATNVTAQHDPTLPQGYTYYTFDIDGPTFANYVAAQYASANGASLGSTSSLGVSPVLKSMSGRGELWVGRRRFATAPAS